ncbi:toll-like receptor 1 [Haliotis asinina]|uniref:toll-like receptor 1 n=1 Tax=Haliotis asinina TaxID=109174 RepID=UPI003531DB5E
MIQEDAFPEESRNTLKYIGLEHNSFTCSCDMKWFILWIQRDHHKFTGYPSSYACAYPSEFRSVLLSDVSFSEQYCLFQKTVYVLLLGFITLGVVLVAVVSIIYKCRWRFRYFLYLIRHLELHKPRDGQDCTYDGFVVYSPSDTTWLTEHLIPCMEERNGLKLCIHERDFDVGGAIVDNIVESIEASKKILIVLSVNSLQSEWCLFEINFAQRRAVGETHTFVVVLLGNIPGRLISSSLRAMLEEHPCLIWPAEQGDESARDMFWEQVMGYFRH